MTTALTLPHPTARVSHRGLHYGKTVEVIELHARRRAGATDSVTAVLDVPGRPRCRRILSVGDLEPLPIPAEGGREYFNAVADDYWVCVCGNAPGAAGHYATYRSGVEVDPGGDDWQRDGECYCCADCGRIGALVERDTLGRILVIGTAKHLPTGEPIVVDYTS
jgi:hypothetical protein